jgi:predicted transcriptional regulator
VDGWYEIGTICFMAMNLRVPVDLDRRLEQLAAEEHTSKSALLLQGAELVLQRHRRSREIGEGLDFVMSHDAELLTRLEDA